MKQIFKFFILFIGIHLFSGCGSSGTSSNDNVEVPQSPLKRGVNFGNSLEAPKEGDWGVIIQKHYFRMIKDAGFDFVRVPINWHSNSLSTPPYTINASFFNRIDQIISWAEQYGLSIIIDVHHFDDMIYRPYETLPRFQAIWRQIAERYADRPDSLYFEIINEPNANLSAEIWNEIYPQILSTIRESNPSRWIIIDGPFWSNWQTLRDLKVADDPKIIASFHYYNPMEFTHQGAEWDSRYEQYIGTTWMGTDDQKKQIDESFQYVSDWAAQNKIPILLGEFGVYYKAPPDSRANWTRYVKQQAEKLNFAWAIWDFNGGFPIYNNSTDSWYDQLLDALLN